MPRDKLKKKNMDIIVANDVTKEGAGFGYDTNIIKIISADGKIESVPLMGKMEVADRILDRVKKIITGRKSAPRRKGCCSGRIVSYGKCKRESGR